MAHSGPLVVIAIFKAVPGQEQALRAAQETMVEATVKEIGCLRYELNQSITDPTVTIFTEIWETEQAWKDHMEGDVIKHFKATASHLFEDLKLHQLTLVADRRK